MANTNIMTGYTYIPVIVFCRCCFGYNIQLPGLKPWLALVWLCHCRYNAMLINQSYHHDMHAHFAWPIKHCFLHPEEKYLQDLHISCKTILLGCKNAVNYFTIQFIWLLTWQNSSFFSSYVANSVVQSQIHMPLRNFIKSDQLVVGHLC